jgi:hypothetical protein
MILRINGVDIKNPSDLSYSRYNITKAGRVASGDMKLDLVAKKRKLFFTYEVIKGKDMEHILSLIDTDELFFTVTYEENNVIKQAVMYVGEISQDRFRTRDSTTKQWYWKNFTFNLIEQ